MIEPTETESRQTLDKFVEACEAILKEDPKLLHEAPVNTARRRLDEAKAAREMIFSWRAYKKKMESGTTTARS
jgi:glycine dehydrogenase subunit 2